MRVVHDCVGEQASRGAAPPLAEKKDNSPEDLARDMEKQVSRPGKRAEDEASGLTATG